jgi:hypothetical protein
MHHHAHKNQKQTVQRRKFVRQHNVLVWIRQSIAEQIGRRAHLRRVGKLRSLVKLVGKYMHHYANKIQKQTVQRRKFVRQHNVLDWIRHSIGEQIWRRAHLRILVWIRFVVFLVGLNLHSHANKIQKQIVQWRQLLRQHIVFGIGDSIG